MDAHCTLDTHQKALAINLDDGKYGTIAEIGAGVLQLEDPATTELKLATKPEDE